LNITKQSYKLLKKIKDPKFNIDNLEYYNLSINLGVRDLQVFIFDTKAKRSLLLEDYVFDRLENDRQRFDILRHIYDEHHLLAAGFWNVITIMVKNRKFSLVPAELFQKDQAHRYLALNANFDPEEETVHSIHHKSARLINVFAMNKRFSDHFVQAYPNRKVRFIHQSSTIINGALNKSDDGRRVLLYVDRFILHIISVKSGKLEYYNQFPIKKLDDYLRYLKLVSSEISIDIKNDPFIVYGFLGKNTPHFNYLKEHIRNIKLGERPANFKFGYVFDEVADHNFFDLYSLYSVKSSS